MANSKTADPKVFPPPKTSHRATPQDQVIVYMLGFDQITPESFRVKLQAQVTLAGGRDAEGLPAGFFLNNILVGKTVCDEFGVADIALTIAWAALQQGKTLVVKVKGMEKAAPVKWNIPKSPAELEAEEHERQEQERLRIIAGISQNMVNISAGTFWMGATDADQFKQTNELPRHQVTLAAFAIGKYPITQAQWQAVMGNNPSQFQGADRPVENVSWDDAQEFCRRLNASNFRSLGDFGSLTFRLPTEAEWEYACRAGTQTIWHFGNDPAQLGNYAWFDGNSGGETHPVGQLQPNAWGLYDMLGNVWEWCADWFDEQYYANSPQESPQGPSEGQYRVVRNAGWFNEPYSCRSSARRAGNNPDCRSEGIGFRVAISRTP